MGERSDLGVSSPLEATAFGAVAAASQSGAAAADSGASALDIPPAAGDDPHDAAAHDVPAAAPPDRPAPGRSRLRWAAGLVVLGVLGAALATTVGQPEPPSVVVRLPTPTVAAPLTGAAAPLTGAAAPPAAPTPATDPVNPAFNAPLLGAVRPVWVESRGQPSQGVFGELFAATTGVRWRDDGAGRARAVQVELLTGSAPVPVGQAREMAARFHPRDGQRVGVYVDALGQTVEVFRSAALAEVFGGADSPAAKAVFGSEPAGTYVQIAERGAPRTTRVLLAVGAVR
jgi:hypothetical protein